MCFLLMSNDNVLSVEDDAEHVENTGSNIRNYYKVDGAQSKWNIRCIFCDHFLTGGRAVLAQKKANVGSCVRIRKNDYNRYVDCAESCQQSNDGQKRLLSCLQANKSVLDSMIYSGNRTVESKHWTLLLQASFSYC